MRLEDSSQIHRNRRPLGHFVQFLFVLGVQVHIQRTEGFIDVLKAIGSEN